MFKKEKNQKLNLKIKDKDIDPGALFIIQRLNDLGYEALVVGGCIRNLVMRQEANDWDVAARATTEEITEVFRDYKVVPVGRKFGTVTLVINHINYQVSTFKRSKSAYGPNIFEDLGHRDFTINALAWKGKEGVLDYFSGLMDIQHKLIRGVEDPVERIKEDPLRMLRAVRLACELDFKIEKNTLAAIHKNSGLIQNISPERIRNELIKILISNFPKRGLILLQQLGVWPHILPECLDRKAFEHILNIVDNLPSDLILRLSALLYPGYFSSTSRRERAAEILKKLRFKNSTIKKVGILVQEDWQADNFSDEKKIRECISKIGIENIWYLLKLIEADNKASNNLVELKKVKKIKQKVNEFLKEKPPVSLKDLALNGEDLIDLGYQEGKEMGRILKMLLKIVIDKPELNKREILLDFIRNKKC